MSKAPGKKTLVSALAVILSLLLTAMGMFLAHLVREFLADLPPW